MRWSISLLFTMVLVASIAFLFFTLARPIIQALFLGAGKTSFLETSVQKAYRTVQNPIVVVGVVRSSGLTDEQKTEIELPFSAYQIADLEHTGTSVSLPDGYVLALPDAPAVQKLIPYIGRCVEMQLAPLLVISDIQKDAIFGRSIAVPRLITELPFTRCTPYPEVVNVSAEEKEKKYEAHGVLSNAVRPAIDINYDYTIRFAPPFQKIHNAESESGSFTEMVIVPGNKNVWKRIEENIGKSVRMTGYVRWGYAESRYFLVDTVSE